jgi:hypothetical protein
MVDRQIKETINSHLGIQMVMREWLRAIESATAEKFLQLLLQLMALACQLDLGGFARNIEGFAGRYLFRSKDNGITVSVVFQNGKMSVSDDPLDHTDLVVTFRNAKALMEYILSPKPDILGSMLRQDVTLSDNLNYLYKFAFMAKRLQLMAAGKL